MTENNVKNLFSTIRSIQFAKQTTDILNTTFIGIDMSASITFVSISSIDKDKGH